MIRNSEKKLSYNYYTSGTFFEQGISGEYRVGLAPQKNMFKTEKLPWVATNILTEIYQGNHLSKSFEDMSIFIRSF